LKDWAKVSLNYILKNHEYSKEKKGFFIILDVFVKSNGKAKKIGPINFLKPKIPEYLFIGELTTNENFHEILKNKNS
jgi:hypothetical protein